MKLQDYFDRIGFGGGAKPDLPTFRALHRAHAQSIPYENLDVQLGAPVTREIGAIFDKIVRRRRGGWCYEMNGLLGWALEEIGFDVDFLAGGVTRDINGDAVVGNHLVLLVGVDGRKWVGDVGFGDGLIEPSPLEEGPVESHPLKGAFKSLGKTWWRYSNEPRTGGPTFDFSPAANDPALLDAKCVFLQTDAGSPFVQNAVLQKWRGPEHYSLRGRVLRRLTPDTDERSLIAGPDAYVETLQSIFDLDFPDAARLWPKIEARHAALFSGKNPLAAG